MTTRTLALAATAVACALSMPVASALEEAGQFYITPMMTYIDPEGSLGGNNLEDGVEGGQLAAGFALGDRWNIELALQRLRLDAENSSARVKESGALVNVLNVYNRAGRFSPYLLGGIGWLQDDYSGIAKSNDNSLQAQAGVGLFTDLFGDRVALRTEAVYRWVDADSNRDEVLINLGVQVALGSKSAPAPAAVAVAAPPPPPPPAPPSDSDGDGVVNANDQCPDTPKGDRVGSQGCSCDVTRQVQFAFDSAKLTDEGRATLDEVAERLTQLKFVSGTVTGHTDSAGSDAYNQSLSQRRAQTVSGYLQAHGIGVGRIEVAGAGESQPIADNDTDEGRALNRRVVLKRTDCN